MASADLDAATKRVTRKPTQNSGFGSSLNVNYLIDIEDANDRLNRTQMHVSGKGNNFNSQ